MLKFLTLLLWGLGTLLWWIIILAGAGFAGWPGAIVALAVGLALWLPATTLITDWLGLTKVWPHARLP